MFGNKYRAKKVAIGDEKFDSKAEYRRFLNLSAMEDVGKISELKRQVPFILAPSVKFDGENRAKPPLKYVADFVYIDSNGNQVVEDVKGMETPEFRIKRHLMVSVHGVQIRVVKG